MAGQKSRMSYPLQFWIAVSGALLGAFQFGYQTAILNTALDTVMKDIGFASRAVVTSMVVLGAMVGAICAGSIADMIGPKKAQLLNVLPFTLGASLAAFCPVNHWLTFLAGRFISGMGAGAGSLYVPRYLSEISPPSLRGNLVTQNQVLINAGVLVSYAVGMPYDNPAQWERWDRWFDSVKWWRLMICFSYLPAAVQAILLLVVPESPVWLENHDRDEADRACIALWGCEAIAPQMQDEETELHEAEALAGEEGGRRNKKEGWLALLKREYRWMMALAIGAPLLQQASGINTVIYYSSDVFRLAQLRSPVVGSILMGVVNLLFTLLAGALMDRKGRRPLLMLSYVGMACSLAAFSCFYNTTWVSGQLQGALMCSMILLYVMFFALGVGPIPWLYMSEILPDRIKGRAASAATFLAWGGNLLVTLSFDRLIEKLGLGNAYLVYALGNTAGAVFTYFLVVETKCFTFAAIERLLLLLPPPPATVFHSTAGRGTDATTPLLGQLPPPATVFPRSFHNHQSQQQQQQQQQRQQQQQQQQPPQQQQANGVLHGTGWKHDRDKPAATDHLLSFVESLHPLPELQEEGAEIEEKGGAAEPKEAKP